MRRTIAVLVGILLVTTPAIATDSTLTSETGTAPNALHGNHLSVDPQVSDDGTIVVESMYTLSRGFLVVHRDRGGTPGEPVGNTNISRGLHTNVEVRIDDEQWQDHEGNRTYWLVMHLDVDGNGAFDWGIDDPMNGLGGSVAGGEVPVRRSADGDARILVSRPDGQRIDSPTVTLPRVQLDRSGHVVLRRVANGSPGDIVGTRSLEAGTHEDVTVDLDDSFFESRTSDRSVGLVATLHRDDGNGNFEVGADVPVRVGEDIVASRFSVTKVRDDEATSERLINTPESTTEYAATTDASTTHADVQERPLSGFGAVAMLGSLLLLVAGSRPNGR